MLWTGTASSSVTMAVMTMWMMGTMTRNDGSSLASKLQERINLKRRDIERNKGMRLCRNVFGVHSGPMLRSSRDGTTTILTTWTVATLVGKKLFNLCQKGRNHWRSLLLSPLPRKLPRGEPKKGRLG